MRCARAGVRRVFALALVLAMACACAQGCRGPKGKRTPPKLPIHVEQMSRVVPEGPRRDAFEEEWRRRGRAFARRLFADEPMPLGKPAASISQLAGSEAFGRDLQRRIALEQRRLAHPPEWSRGVRRPASRTAHDLPRQWPIMVKRGETMGLLSKWARQEKKHLIEDNRDVLPRRRWLRPGDRLRITMSANQKLAFDQAREAFHQRKLENYFAKRYIDRVVRYVIRRGDVVSHVAKRYGAVPSWLLEAFNQTDFRTVQPGDVVLIPVVKDLKKGQRAPPALKVVGTDGKPLTPSQRAQVQSRLRTDLVGRARLAVDDSNVFERVAADGPPTTQPLPHGFSRAWDAPRPEAGPAPVEPSMLDQLPEVLPPPPDSLAPRIITVKRGETLGHYARWSSLDVEEIVAANLDLDPDLVKVGQRITLPLDDIAWVTFVLARTGGGRLDRAAAAARAQQSAVDARGLKPLGARPVPAVIRGAGRTGVAVAPLASRADARPGRMHVVASGDIASRIARKYRLSLADLREANPDRNLDRIMPGEELRIPPSQTSR